MTGRKDLVTGYTKPDSPERRAERAALHRKVTTTTTRNEAAERLRRVISADGQYTVSPKAGELLDAALAAERRIGLEQGIRRTIEETQSMIAAERRATVERIRARLLTPKGYERANVDLFAILEEEADR